ncbi:MAG: hypothetical protein ABIG64_06475 [Candidatus Omnitrophota bacterium]
MFLRNKKHRGKRGKYIFTGIFILAFMLGSFYLTDSVFTQEGINNVVIKIIGVNPSKTQSQKLTLRTHLPEEVTPEDIMDKEDLEISYDTEKSAYYVYGEYELGPEETIEREVEIKNIWHIPEVEIESIRLKTDETVELLENTEFKEKADFLKKSIEDKLSEIEKRQKVTATNPQKHISDFRDNKKLLEAAKKDLMLARTFVSQVKVLPTMTIWKLFFIVVIILLILSSGFYFFWFRQSRSSQPSVLTGSAREDITLEQHKEKEKKEVSADDIEKMMGQ